MDPDTDPNGANILDPDPNSKYLDPQHWLARMDAYLVLDGGGVEHGHVVYGDALLDDPLTALLQLLLTVRVGQVQQPCQQNIYILLVTTV